MLNKKQVIFEHSVRVFLKIISWNRHYQDQLLDFCIFKNGAQRSLAKSIGGFWLAYPIFYLWPQKYPDYTLGRRIPTSIRISHADEIGG